MSLMPIGRLIHADKNGVLPRIGCPPHPSWSSVLNDLVWQLQSHCTDNAFSVVLRGSVARGASLNEAADLDLVILYDDTMPPIQNLQSNVVPTLPIEVSYIERNALKTDAKWVWMRFMLAHNGHTILGPDTLKDLPEPRIGPQCYAHLRDADEWLRDWRLYWDRDQDYPAICTWLMKRIVRALFESQVTRINAFSRDIYPCAQVAKDAFPHARPAIHKAAELAITPTSDFDTIDQTVGRLSDILLSQHAEITM